MMGFVPLIVHMFEYDANLSQFDWFPASSGLQTDFFFAWKMIAIVIIGVVMIGIMLYRYLKKKEQFQFENSFYMLFVYAMFVAMSALFSSYKYWVVRGTYELFEPVWAVFAYMILCYYVYNYVQEEKQVNKVLLWAGVGMAMVTLIGVFQYFGKDFFKTGFGKHLITNTSFWGNLDSLNFNMAESGIGGGRHHWKYCDCQYHIFWGKNQEHDYRYLSYTKTYRQNWIGTPSGP